MKDCKYCSYGCKIDEYKYYCNDLDCDTDRVEPACMYND